MVALKSWHISSTVSKWSAAESRLPRPTSRIPRAPFAMTPDRPTACPARAAFIQRSASCQRPSRKADRPRTDRSATADPSIPQRALSAIASSATWHASSRSPAQWSARASSRAISAAPENSPTDRARVSAWRRVRTPDSASPTAAALRPMQRSARISASAEPTCRAVASASWAKRADSSKCDRIPSP